MRRRCSEAVGLFLLVVSLAACRQAGQPGEARSPLAVDPNSRDISQNSQLLERVLASPHGYLRFINIPFSQEVCRRFSDTFEGVPLFNLHGDAHLEQYAVTDLGRGLTDFDDSSLGPAIVDIMRLAVSLRLAARANGWQDKENELLGRFLAGYRAALEDPSVPAPVPAVAERLMADFIYDREEYFAWFESIKDPVPPEEVERLVAALDPYVESMIADHAELGRSFFEAVDVGYLRLGIGSALDRKYVVRIRGATEDPGDDVVLELKQVRDLTGIDCISVGKGTDPFRILIGQSRIAYQPYRLLGYVRFDDLTFWIHAWVDNYVELSVEESFRTPEELAEVAYDIGIQLGRGHPNQIAAPLDQQLRREQLRLLDRDRSRILSASLEMAGEVTEAWEAFTASYR